MTKKLKRLNEMSKAYQRKGYEMITERKKAILANIEGR
jgi:hypothetical protein